MLLCFQVHPFKEPSRS